MKPQSGYGLASCGLFLLAMLLFLLTSVALDSALNQLSLGAQRWIIALALVLPALLGAALGVAGLAQRGRGKLAAAAGTLLNAAFAAYFGLLLAVAG